MKKRLIRILVLIMALSLAACSGMTNTDDPVINDQAETEQDTIKESTDKGKVYSNKVYYIGDDVPEGTYVINCTKSEYGMDAVVFQSETEYNAFQDEKQITVGEHRAAIEKYAWASFYMEEGETAYISLKSGNIILLDDGMCEFSKYDALTSNILYSGIYVVGEDIYAGGLDIQCTTDYLQIVAFENAEEYSKYHKSSRFTHGEELDAIEAYSVINNHIYENDNTSVNLKEGMILMIDDGTGEYSVDEGPVIKGESQKPVEEKTKTALADAAQKEKTTIEEQKLDTIEFVDGMRPEFKEAMDSYEAFYDEYCNLMSKYKANPTDTALLTEYTDMMDKIVEMDEKFDAWEDNDLNKKEWQYYLEVTNRISQKVIDIM